jgi:hypothetical protein
MVWFRQGWGVQKIPVVHVAEILMFAMQAQGSDWICGRSLRGED